MTEPAGVVLVTGASRGLGATMARHLGASGWRVAVNFRNDLDGARQVVADIRAKGGSAEQIQADVTDEDEVAGLVERVEEHLGPVSVLVANATGSQPEVPVEDLTWQAHLDQLVFFVKSPTLLVQAVLPGMRAMGRGRIIQIGSDIVDRSLPGTSAYASAKAAQLALTRIWARELGPSGITVNLVAPGWIPVERHASESSAAVDAYTDAVPLGRMGTPDDVAAMVGFLASDAAAFITGERITVNGGHTIGWALGEDVDMKFTSYWLDTAPQGSPERAASSMEGRADVAVIGGGITGVVAALHLARRGATVHLFEQHSVGFGASGRNGGMATTGMTINIRDAVDKYGFATAARLHAAYGEAIDLIEELVTDENLDCDFSRPGKLLLAAKPAHYQGFEKTVELLNTRLGSDAELVRKADLRREIGSDTFHGAMTDSASASLHVGKYIRGLGEAAERAGVTIHEHAPIERLTKTGSGHELETPRGRIQADQVLLATGAYTRRPFRWHQVRIAPVGSFIIATEPLDASVCDDLLPTRRVASDSKNLLNYFRITPDNRLLFGGRARFAVSNPQSDEKSGKLLRDAMAGIFPQLSDARIDYCWGGLVDMTLDRMVKAGQHDGVYYSMGYAGHGVQMATFMGRQMAEYMSGVLEANIWRGFEFRRIPGHFGPPWFLPVAGSYYKFKDRIR